MLVSVEMYSVHAARRRYGTCVEEVAGQIGADLAIDLGQARAPLLRSGKLGGDGSLRATNGRRRHQEDGRDGHPGLDGRLPDLSYKSDHALTCRPSVVVGVAKLKIIRAQHKDHES